MQRWWTEPADRLVAGPAGQLARGFDHRGERIERRPVPRAGRAENADRRRADGRRDMQEAGIVRDRGRGGGERQDGVAQVGAGQVADAVGRRRDDLGRERLARPGRRSPRPRRPRPPSRRGQRGVRGRPASASTGRPRRAPAPRPGGRRPRAPAAARQAAISAGGNVEFRQRPVRRAAARLAASASAAQRSIMRGRARSPQRRSLSRPKRASPTKPVRSGMPARNGASADFQVRGITSAWP